MSGPTQHPLPNPTYFPCSRARSAFPTPCLRSSHGRSLHSSRAYTHRCGIASDELKDAARKWVDKLTVKNGAYAPDAFPNPGEICHWPRCDGPTLSSMPFSHRFHPLGPAGRRPAALSYHNAQLEASAFREEFDPTSFEDPTEPKYDRMHQVQCSLLSHRSFADLSILTIRQRCSPVDSARAHS